MDQSDTAPLSADRRRKQTVVTLSQSEQPTLTDPADTDIQPSIQEGISPPHFALGTLSSVEDDVFESDDDIGPKRPKRSKLKPAKSNGDVSNETDEETSDDSTDEINRMVDIDTNLEEGAMKDLAANVNGEVKHDQTASGFEISDTDTKDFHGNTNQAASLVSDVIYDETKPRRLPHPKSNKLDLDRTRDQNNAFQESINRLISPDDDSGSPKRRNRKPLMSVKSAPIVTSQNNATSSPPGASGYPRSRIESTPPSRTARQEYSLENKPIQTIQVPNYKQSPDTKRRKVSSPVQRLIVKNSPLAAAAAACSKDRKISVEARLGHYYDRSYIPPKRKISSDARLEHRYAEEQLRLPSNSGPKRKVSFDTTTLINGRKMMPLNDEYTVKEEPEKEIMSKRPTNLNIPTVILTSPEDDKPAEENEENIEEEKQCENNSNSNSEYSEEGYASGYDNSAYVADEEPEDEDFYSENSRSKQAYASGGTIESERRTTRLSAVTDQPMGFDEPAVISHTAENFNSNRFRVKKVSDSSLPDRYGRKISTGSDLSPPRSILKVKRDDGDSLVSEDSIAGKSFKVRKDSLALFMDQHGQLSAVEELRKEHEGKNFNFRCFGKSQIRQLWTDRKMLVEKYKLHLVVLVLFLLTFAFVIIGLHYHSEHNEMIATSQKVFFEPRKRHFTLRDPRGDDTLSGTLGLDIPAWKMPTHCHSNFKSITEKSCLKWKEHGQLDIAYFVENRTQCYNITWNILPGTSVFDCINVADRYWYGPLNTTTSQWPIRDKQFTFNVNNTKHYGSGTFASAVEYYWLSSNGEAVVVDSHYALEISWNVRKPGAFCLMWKPPGKTKQRSWHNFSYAVCNGDNIQYTHALIRKRYYPAITSIPDKAFLSYPHWSAVADSDQFNLNDSIIDGVVSEMKKNRMNCSSIEIDGKWERKYGDLTFDTHDFDNITDLVKAVSSSGCNLSLHVYPYFDFHSANFLEGMNHKYFIRDSGGTVPALLHWEHGVGAMLDVSNPAAREWYSTKLRNVATKLGINTFRLVYGSSSWIPSNSVFHTDEISPTNLKLMFSDLLSSLGNAVVESTSHSQHISTLITISSSVVNDGRRYCLKNIIPDVLNLGLMGYPFVMADGFDVSDKFEKSDGYLPPSRDLYIRWMQLSTFFPAVRYTVKPWRYDSKVLEASRRLSQFHSMAVMNFIYQYQGKIMAGAPILQPMWWNRSNEKDTFLIDDQFILADAYLVAPILCECQVDNDVAERDIYIPAGVWKDINDDRVVIGPKWLRRYKASQFQIPLFERMPEYGE